MNPFNDFVRAFYRATLFIPSLFTAIFRIRANSFQTCSREEIKYLTHLFGKGFSSI